MCIHDLVDAHCVLCNGHGDWTAERPYVPTVSLRADGQLGLEDGWFVQHDNKVVWVERTAHWVLSKRVGWTYLTVRGEVLPSPQGEWPASVVPTGGRAHGIRTKDDAHQHRVNILTAKAAGGAFAKWVPGERLVALLDDSEVIDDTDEEAWIAAEYDRDPEVISWEFVS